MKKLLIVTSILFLFHSASFSQQPEVILSPEIHPDNTVTFRLPAPQAIKVEITGDFLPATKTQTPYGESEIPGVAELAKNDKGVWEFTTPAPLAPELYNYTFIVDGAKVIDPNNVYMFRDVDAVTNLFIIGGGRTDLYKVNDVPHGTVARRWYDSPTLGKTRRITIYTPSGYEADNGKYPVFYLLHGAGGDEEAWITLGRTAQTLDNLIAQGKAKPMIVVMPNGNVSQKSAPGESERGMYRPSMRDDTRMDGEFEAAFPDIMNFVESNYRTINAKASRAIAGLSMGGFHAMHISKQYPDKFDYVGLFSAALLSTRRMKSEAPVYENEEEKLKIQFNEAPKLYWIAIGKTDFLYEMNEKYRKMLDKNGYKYIYHESEDGHIWKNWRIYLTEFVPMLF
jgi:enterochelin esterase family protein